MLFFSILGLAGLCLLLLSAVDLIRHNYSTLDHSTGLFTLCVKDDRSFYPLEADLVIAFIAGRVFTFRRQTAFGGIWASHFGRLISAQTGLGGKTAFGGKRASRFGRLIIKVY